MAHDHVAEPIQAVLASVRPLPLEALPRDGRAPLDVEAGRAAWEEYEAVAGQLPPRDAVVLAALAYVRHLDARRMAHSYPLASGVRVARQHPEAVRAALATFAFWGGAAGSDPEGAMARALAASEGWWQRHLAEERTHERRHRESTAQLGADRGKREMGGVKC